MTVPSRSGARHNISSEIWSSETWSSETWSSETWKREVRHARNRTPFIAPEKSLRPVRQVDRIAGMGRARSWPHLLSLALHGLRLSFRVGSLFRAPRGRRRSDRRLISRRRFSTLLPHRQFDAHG